MFFSLAIYYYKSTHYKVNRFTCSKSELTGVTALFGITLLLFTTILNPALSFSRVSLDNNENNFENSKKSHEQKHIPSKATRDPFKFPMPLGGLDIDRTDSIYQNQDENSQQDNNLASPSNSILKHSTFKATIIPDKKSIKNKIENTANGSFNINSGSADTIQNNIISIHSAGSKQPTVANGNISDQIYNLHINGKSFPVRYQLTGSANKLLSMTMQNSNATILTYLSSSSPGMMTIELARNIIDSKNKDLRLDSRFAVFEDGHMTSFVETENNNFMRQISIPFSKGTSQIAIVGTHASPEYSAATVLYGVSMCISIVIIVALTRYKIIGSISHSHR